MLQSLLQMHYSLLFFLYLSRCERLIKLLKEKKAGYNASVRSFAT